MHRVMETLVLEASRHVAHGWVSIDRADRLWWEEIASTAKHTQIQIFVGALTWLHTDLQ